MDKAKLKQIMAESVLLRETALESFSNRLNRKTFGEATKILAKVGAVSYTDLREKVLSGDIAIEALEVPEDEKKKEAAEDEEELAESAEDKEDKTTMEKLVTVVERLHRRLEALEDEEEKKTESAEDEEEKKTESAEDEEEAVAKEGKKKTKKESADSNADDTSGDEITKGQVDADTGKMPVKGTAGVTSGEDPETGKMPESAESDDANEDEQPKPPVVKESLGSSYDVDIRREKLTTRSASRFNNLFK